MININGLIKEETKEYNPNWQEIPDDPYRMLITGASGSVKANSLFNLINQQRDIEKTYLYAKDPYKAKYQFLINKQERTSLKHFTYSTDFIEHSNDMDDIYKNIQEYNRNKKRKK